MPRANARAVRKRHVPWKAERSLPSPEVLLFNSTTWRAVDPCGHGLIRREKTSEGIANAEDVLFLSKLHVTNCYCRLKLPEVENADLAIHTYSGAEVRHRSE